MLFLRTGDCEMRVSKVDYVAYGPLKAEGRVKMTSQILS